MAGLINELIDILNQQCVNYDELLALSTEKKRVLINNDVQTLQKISIVENKIIGRNQKLETKRLELMLNIASVLNQNPDALTLNVLSELMVNQEEYPALMEVKEKLKKIIMSLKELNDINNDLIKSSLEYVEFTINLVRSVLSEKPSYHSSKNMEVSDERGFFDAKQ